MMILLTGQKGSGKSTVAMGLARRLSQKDIQVGGIICPGIFEQGRKVGIKSHHPASGHEELLGKECSLIGKPVPESTGPDTFSYGRWEFRQSAMAAADASITKDLETSRIVFVDEIGPLELEHGLGMSRTLGRLDADRNINNCIIVVCARQDLTQQLSERWPGSILVELTGEGPSAIGMAETAVLDAINRLGSSPSATGNAQP